MKKTIFVLVLAGFLVACEQDLVTKKPRTMIIAGVPAHDHDYQLNVQK